MGKKCVSLVTGANRGIGLEVAIKLAERGDRVYFGIRDPGKFKSIIENLTQRGLDVLPIQCNLEDELTMTNVVEIIRSNEGYLNILVNNAGVMLEDDGGPSSGPNNAQFVHVDVLLKTFNVNYFGTVGLTQKLLPLLEKAPYGRIVNVSSILGSVALQATSDDPRLPNHRQLAYNSSKASLNMFTIHLSKALEGTDIRVNSIHPGWVRTAMGGQHAERSPEEAASDIIKLASDSSDVPRCSFLFHGHPLPW